MTQLTAIELLQIGAACGVCQRTHGHLLSPYPENYVSPDGHTYQPLIDLEALALLWAIVLEWAQRPVLQYRTVFDRTNRR